MAWHMGCRRQERLGAEYTLFPWWMGRAASACNSASFTVSWKHRATKFAVSINKFLCSASTLHQFNTCVIIYGIILIVWTTKYCANFSINPHNDEFWHFFSLKPH